jgi:hypothetical protein
MNEQKEKNKIIEAWEKYPTDRVEFLKELVYRYKSLLERFIEISKQEVKNGTGNRS